MSFKTQMTQPYVALVEFHQSSLDQRFTQFDWDSLRLHFESLCEDPNVDVIVFSNVGCDSSELTRLKRNGQPDRRMRKCIDAVVACAKRESLLYPRDHYPPIPLFSQELISMIAVICITAGFCSSINFELACACDIRIATYDTRFAVNDVDVGIGDDPTTIQLLARLVGNSSWIRDVIFTAREFDAIEALKVGLVSKISSSEDEAHEEGLRLAGMIAARDSRLVQRSKQALSRIRRIRASKQP